MKVSYGRGRRWGVRLLDMKMLKTALVVAALALPVAASAQDTNSNTETTQTTTRTERGFDWGWLGLLGLAGLLGRTRQEPTAHTTTQHR